MFAAYSDLSLLANIPGTTHHHHSGWTTLMTTRTMIFPAHGDFKAHIAGNTVMGNAHYTLANKTLNFSMQVVSLSRWHDSLR